jgi:alkylhydroperoxidase/carboxymuconolactone decarboxylase family protein YurZ
VNSNPLDAFERLDPDLLKRLGENHGLDLGGGALPEKTKLLMVMAIDACLGSFQGVHALAVQAMQAGATRQEVAEAVRVAYYVGGASALYTAGRGLEDLF